MKLLPCQENAATHVQILPDDFGHCDLINVTTYGVYRLLSNDEHGFEGEEMIETDDGHFACSFSLVVNVRWLREVAE